MAADAFVCCEKLMKAVKMTGMDIKVVNSAFPDGCGPILKTRGMALTVGIGNVANSYQLFGRPLLITWALR